MKQQWLGPYTVNKNLENGVYQLENKGAVLKTTVNQCCLKLCIVDAEVITNFCSIIVHYIFIIHTSHYNYL